MTRTASFATTVLVFLGWCSGQDEPPIEKPLTNDQAVDLLTKKSTLKEEEFLALPPDEVSKIHQAYTKYYFLAQRRIFSRKSGDLIQSVLWHKLPYPKVALSLLTSGLSSEALLKRLRAYLVLADGGAEMIRRMTGRAPLESELELIRALRVGLLLEIYQAYYSAIHQALLELPLRVMVKATATNEKGAPTVGATVIIRKRKRDGAERVEFAETDEQGEVEIETNDDETVTEVTVTGKDTKEKKVVNPQPDADGNLKVTTDERGLPIAFVYDERTETADLFVKKIADELAKLVNADPKDLTNKLGKMESKPITVDGKETHVTIFETTWYVDGKRIPNDIVEKALEELNKNDPDLGIIGPKIRKPAFTTPKVAILHE